MTTPDRARWDDRYRSAQSPTAIDPPAVILSPFAEVNETMTVLDIACGWGDTGLHLATRGATVSFVDISAVAIEAVEERAALHGLDVSTYVQDLTTSDVPDGPWDLITCSHYLDRDLLPRLVDGLSSTGQLICAIATSTNLERHERPSARFLLEPGELPMLVPNAEPSHFSEEWRPNGAHEAWLFASKKSAAL